MSLGVAPASIDSSAEVPAKGSAEAVRASLLFAMAALGVLEHVFLALPFRDGALWGWALPTRNNRINV